MHGQQHIKKNDYLCRHGHRLKRSLDKSIVPGLPFDSLGDLDQPWVSVGPSRDAELKGSPHQLTLSRISQLETYVVSYELNPKSSRIISVTSWNLNCA